MKFVDNASIIEGYPWDGKNLEEFKRQGVPFKLTTTGELLIPDVNAHEAFPVFIEIPVGAFICRRNEDWFRFVPTRFEEYFTVIEE